ncbi:MAG TPA: flavodoxin-dependent (E)-4-hydroxy-3-methylbut-2-enyl-diphosphate synthase, partial [Candidatus Omnitrophota bacterium]|nr:flavodoxin-dependent (E)-4-hydroxy-3-methylbut-2-enyl-diphosphate synthase [Candidatus Omnitrophota bacterium]
MIKRKKTREVKVGNVKIGAGNPVAIQSMVKVAAKDIERAIRQINELDHAGCEIVRIAVQDVEDARALFHIKKN